MPKIEISKRTELVRGCGYRKVGFYLVSNAFMGTSCGKLPIPLEICPCCGDGIKQTRSWRKIDLRRLAEDRRCSMGMPISAQQVESGRSTTGLREMIDNIENRCNTCPLGGAIPAAAYLLWVGAQHYSAGQFLDEGKLQGISRRIPSTRAGNPQLPKDFELGESIVALAHPEVCLSEEGEGLAPGLFCFFMPQAIEYVIDTSKMGESAYLEYLERLSDRGCSLISARQGTGVVVGNAHAVTPVETPSPAHLDFLGGF